MSHLMQQSAQDLLPRARALGLGEEATHLLTERARRYAADLELTEEAAQSRFLRAAIQALDPQNGLELRAAEALLREIDLRVNDINPDVNVVAHARVGIFGWGLVGPGVANIDEFRERLRQGDANWLERFDGFGQDNFLVGKPKFDFRDYEGWVLERFEANKFNQLQRKMGSNVQFALGAFIQALGQNPGLERTLQEFGLDTHVYVGTGVGDIPMMYNLNLRYYRAQRRWNRFWAAPERCAALRDHLELDSAGRQRQRQEHGIPPDPSELPAGTDEDDAEVARDAWEAYWAARSDMLGAYLEESAALHDVGIRGDIDREKVRVIKKRLVDLKRLNAKWQIPPEPWTCVSANRIWNIDNIPAAQITMLGRIHGASFAPIGACSGFDIALELGAAAIRENRAKAVVVGMTDPPPHPLLLGAFYDAHVISCDGKVSRPLEGLKGTHVSGGSIIWILGDLDAMMHRGHRRLGCEVMATGTSSDAYHIITPSRTGPRLAIQRAVAAARIEPEQIQTWDLHATATPGDWTELQNTTEMIGRQPQFTARKGIFGHGMSVGGGWELTAQHMSMAEGDLYPTLIEHEQMHPEIRKMTDRIVTERCKFTGRIGGKINMGIGGVNGVVLSRVWHYAPTLRQAAAVLGIPVAQVRRRLATARLETEIDAYGVERIPHEGFVRLAGPPAGAA